MDTVTRIEKKYIRLLASVKLDVAIENKSQNDADCVINNDNPLTNFALVLRK